jgi:hypothetical protein
MFAALTCISKASSSHCVDLEICREKEIDPVLKGPWSTASSGVYLVFFFHAAKLDYFVKVGHDRVDVVLETFLSEKLVYHCEADFGVSPRPVTW